MNHKRTATSLVRRYGTRDPFRIAEAMGITVVRVPLKGIRGFYQCMKRCRFIYIADDLSGADARFVCAHELGHAMLHRGYNRIFMDAHTYFPTNRYEVEANRFAVDLLYDDDDLRFFLDYPIQLAADHMGVSVELAEYRLSGLFDRR
jgi:Zn-dependent peptidase ImmA (M78 family)